MKLKLSMVSCSQPTENNNVTKLRMDVLTQWNSQFKHCQNMNSFPIYSLLKNIFKSRRQWKTPWIWCSLSVSLLPACCCLLLFLCRVSSWWTCCWTPSCSLCRYLEAIAITSWASRMASISTASSRWPLTLSCWEVWTLQSHASWQLPLKTPAW